MPVSKLVRWACEAWRVAVAWALRSKAHEVHTAKGFWSRADLLGIWIRNELGTNQEGTEESKQSLRSAAALIQYGQCRVHIGGSQTSLSGSQWVSPLASANARMRLDCDSMIRCPSDEEANFTSLFISFAFRKGSPFKDASQFHFHLSVLCGGQRSVFWTPTQPYDRKSPICKSDFNIRSLSKSGCESRYSSSNTLLSLFRLEPQICSREENVFFRTFKASEKLSLLNASSH